MIKVQCHTNLDYIGREQWPTTLPERPMVGDMIRSGTAHGPTKIKFELKVVRVTWVPRYEPNDSFAVEWICDVELHLNPNQFKNISEFEAAYNRVRRGY